MVGLKETTILILLLFFKISDSGLTKGQLCKMNKDYIELYIMQRNSSKAQQQKL